jgi:hypothetical protein
MYANVSSMKRVNRRLIFRPIAGRAKRSSRSSRYRHHFRRVDQGLLSVQPGLDCQGYPENDAIFLLQGGFKCYKFSATTRRLAGRKLAETPPPLQNFFPQGANLAWGLRTRPLLDKTCPHFLCTIRRSSCDWNSHNSPTAFLVIKRYLRKEGARRLRPHHPFNGLRILAAWKATVQR